MSQPLHFPQVIERVIARNASKNLTPAQMAEAIVEGLDLAEAILGDGETAKIFLRQQERQENVRIQTLTPTPQYREVDTGAAVLIGTPQPRILSETVQEEAPPAARVRNAANPSTQDTYEEADRKKDLLMAEVMNKLPISLTVELPGIGMLVLQRHIKRGPAGTEFIRVLYVLTPEDEDGPQVQLLTANLIIDPDRIKREILAQAAGRYRKNKPVIVPRTPPQPGFPDIEKMMAPRPGEADATASQEELDDWNRITGGVKIGA